MNREIVLSKRASINLANLLGYLEIEWSKKVKDNYIKKLNRALNILKNKPDSFPKSESIKGLHSCVITKQSTLYYKYDRQKIYVVAVFDTRRNPESLKKET